jgi:hypothetical protein
MKCSRSKKKTKKTKSYEKKKKTTNKRQAPNDVVCVKFKRK